jgi:outer membrane receptor protein involved in Fe transport
VFGSIDYAISRSVQARVELRATREHRSLDNQLANFRPGFGNAISSRDFGDITPRLSVQYQPSDSWSAYVSAAKGSQSGGINPVPGLLPSEQTYKPESNWTYELSSQYASVDGSFDVHATAYYIDWTDMQLQGFPNSPGITGLITRNTAGLYTRGLEISLNVRPLPWLQTNVDMSYSNPRFRAGSDDPGSRRFCGLNGTNSTSTFCTIGPAREGTVAGVVLVPYIDGNLPPRSPQTMWHFAAILEAPPLRGKHQLVFRIDANGQDDVFDRAIDGAHFGSRALLDARIDYAVGNWSFTLWGRNLGNEQYVRALSSRGQVFFPTTPRPLDMIYGDGRRFGFSVAHAPGDVN